MLRDRVKAINKRKFLITSVLVVLLAMTMVLIFNKTLDYNKLFGTGENGGVSREEIVATVNSQEIKKEQFEAEFERMKSLYARQGIELHDEDENNLKKLLLSNMINNVLLQQYAEEEGIKVSDEEINNEYQALLSRFESEEEVNEFLSLLQLSKDDLMDKIALQLLAQKCIYIYIEENIDDLELKLSDEEIEKLKVFHDYYSVQSDGFMDFEEAILMTERRLSQNIIDEVMRLMINDLKLKSDIQVFI